MCQRGWHITVDPHVCSQNISSHIGLTHCSPSDFSDNHRYLHKDQELEMITTVHSRLN